MAHARVEAAMCRLSDEISRSFCLEDRPSYSRYSSPQQHGSSDGSRTHKYEYEYGQISPSAFSSRGQPAAPYAGVRHNVSPTVSARRLYPDIEDVYSSPTAAAPVKYNLCQTGGVCCGGGCGAGAGQQQPAANPPLFTSPPAGYATPSPFVQEKVFLREAAEHRHRADHESFFSSQAASRQPLNLEEFLRLQRLNLESMDRHLRHVENAVHSQLLTG